MSRYQVTKTYGHDLGLSCAFRQHKANHSHCSFLHGYALAFEFIFESNTLDGRSWVIDFGGLKGLKGWLTDKFDHKTVIAKDDPAMEAFQVLHDQKIIDLVVLDRVGCETFAKVAFYEAQRQVNELNLQHEKAGRFHRVQVISCKCSEHGSNSATYIGK